MIDQKGISRNDTELMAPVGSFESLMAAIQGGADSVYFGLENLNMRSRSSVNFSLGDLREILDITTRHNVRAYLALNTVMYDEDLPRAREMLDAAAHEGISAVILADQALLEYAASRKLEIHLSTQLNISNAESLRFYSRWADVVVLARELSLDQIRNIHFEIRKNGIKGPSGKPVKLELFAHGALCMAISGKCYLSLHQFNHSANRGECFQVCRRSYLVTDAETGYQLEIDNQYIMSPKDLCTIDFLDRILEAGISVLKIEGRARSPEYVKTVTACYHEALKSIAENSYTEEKIQGWKERLAGVFNRGFWDGYYLGRKMGEWSQRYGSHATRRKEYIGKVVNYYAKIGVAEVQMDAGQLSPSDEVLIIGPTTGVMETKITELRDDNGAIPSAHKGMLIAFRVPGAVRRSDKVYRWVAASYQKENQEL
ncbi:MAG: U32 family peptidase [Bacteroidales bacterium]|nr:U32 family peptidase [Bacteroidales bacterium]